MLFRRKTPKPTLYTIAEVAYHSERAAHEAAQRMWATTRHDVEKARNIRTTNIVTDLDDLATRLSTIGAFKEAAGVTNAIMTIEKNFPRW